MKSIDVEKFWKNYQWWMGYHGLRSVPLFLNEVEKLNTLGEIEQFLLSEGSHVFSA